jgi:hypothetical protein
MTISSGEALLEMRTQRSLQGLPMNCPRELGFAFAVRHGFKVLPNTSGNAFLLDKARKPSGNPSNEPAAHSKRFSVNSPKPEEACWEIINVSVHRKQNLKPNNIPPS